ncbi:OmpA family protein [Halovulum sp. GXIMD14793]
MRSFVPITGFAAGLLILFGPDPQALAEVALRSLDGKVSLSGELIEVTDETFTLQTAAGQLRLNRSDVNCEGEDCPQIPMVTILADAKIGEQVSVADADATFQIGGTLVSFEDQVYGIETGVGRLNIPALGATCDGPGCPREVTVPESEVSEAVLAALRAYQGDSTANATTPGGATLPKDRADSGTLPAEQPGTKTPVQDVATDLPRLTDASAPGFDGVKETEAGRGPLLSRPEGDPAADAPNLPTAQNTGTRTVLGGASDAPDPDLGAALRIALASPSDRNIVSPLLIAFARSRDAEISAVGKNFQLDNGDLIALVGEKASADLILTGDPTAAAQNRRTTHRLLGYQSHVAVVAPENSLDAINLTDLRDVLSGRLRDWSLLGDDDSEVVLLALEGDTGVADNAHQTFADTDSLLSALTRDPTALAVIPTGSFPGTKLLPVRESCGLQWQPDPIAVQTGEYPISRSIGLGLSSNAGELAKAFFDFTGTEAARAPIKAAGLVPVDILRASQADRAEALENGIDTLRETNARTQMRSLIDLMRGTERLSTVFRFRSTSLRLDDVSRTAVRDLLDYLEAENATGRLMLVGFSDNVGGYSGNLLQSQRRASTIADILRQADTSGVTERLDIVELGMSELAPMACNQQALGRAVNRRVEVWLSN